jgi:hypothetical protein
MKKLISVMVVLMGLMTACDMEYGKAEEIEIGNVYDYDFENNIPEMRTVDEILKYVQNNISYSFNNDPDIWGVEDYWQTPEETLILKSGDCEDFVILFQYLLESKLNIETSMIIVQVENHEYRHTVAYTDNIYYDLVDKGWPIHTKLPNRVKVIHTVPYSEIMWMTLNYHDAIGKYN